MAKLWVVSTRGWVQSNSSTCVCAHAYAYVYRRGICLMPHVSRDSKNNEKLSRDFKANSRLFPVVMADTGLHDQETSTCTLCHAFLPWPVNATSFDYMLQPKKKKKRTTSLKSLYVLLVFDSNIFSQSLEVKTRNASAMPDTSWTFFKLWISNWNLQNSHSRCRSYILLIWCSVLSSVA